jgi:hypothetical protein
MFRFAMDPTNCERCRQLLREYCDAARGLSEAGSHLARVAEFENLELLEMAWDDVSSANQECERLQKALLEHVKSHLAGGSL